MDVGGVDEPSAHFGRPARLIICDARPLVRLGLSAAFSRDSDFEIAFEAVTSDDLGELVSRVQPELVVIHTQVPPAGALLIIPELRRHFANLRVLGLADTLDPLVVTELLRVGATGIAHVAEPTPCIVEAARRTLLGLRYLPQHFDGDRIYRTLQDSPLGAMSPREREVFVLLGRGHTNAETARQLSISIRTVETHRQRIMRKLDTHSIGGLIVLARRLGVIGWIH